MGDLLTFVHLHLLAKQVRSIYDYGFRFIVAYKGNLYKPVLDWTDDVIKKTHTILKELISHAERITGIRNVVELVDIVELIQRENEYFPIQWEEEIEKIRSLYSKGDEYIQRKINGWLKDYKKSYDTFSISNKNEFDKKMFEQALRIRALKQIQYIGGEKGIGICNSLPPTIRITVRGIDPELSLQLNPYFRFHSHQRLLALTNQKNGTLLSGKMKIKK